MVVDTAAIRALAGRLRDRSRDIRAEAQGLAVRADAVSWTGLAADAMRRAVHEQARRLRACAIAQDSAADALDRHAREVDHHLALVAAVEHSIPHGIGHVLERCL